MKLYLNISIDCSCQNVLFSRRGAVCFRAPRMFSITVKRGAAGFSESSVSNDFRLWYVTPCCLVEVYGSFRRCLLIAVGSCQVIDGRHSHSNLHAVTCQYRAVFCHRYKNFKRFGSLSRNYAAFLKTIASWTWNIAGITTIGIRAVFFAKYLTLWRLTTTIVVVPHR